MAALSKKEAATFQDSLHILTTQIETINQQLAGSGGGTNPAVSNGIRDISAKVTYLYQGMQSLQTQMKAESQGVVVQVGGLVKQGLDKNLGEMAARLAEIQQSLTLILQALRSSPAINSQDIAEIKKTIHELASIYKDEADLFRRQNEFLQKKLMSIEAKLDALGPPAAAPAKSASISLKVEPKK